MDNSTDPADLDQIGGKKSLKFALNSILIRNIQFYFILKEILPVLLHLRSQGLRAKYPQKCF
jgi:hypothetical protein